MIRDGQIYVPEVGYLTIKELLSGFHMARDGSLFKLDTRNEICLKYGFKYKERVSSFRGTATVVGVADNKLWFQLDDDEGRISFWGFLDILVDSEAIKSINSYQEPIFVPLYDIVRIYYLADTKKSVDQINIFSELLPTECNPGKRSMFSCLPIDCIIEIIKYLAPYDVFRISFFCYEWYRIFRNENIWKYFCSLYKIPYDKNILVTDYDENIVDYFFLYGLPRTLSFDIANFVASIKGRRYSLGGAIIRFEIINKYLCVINCMEYRIDNSLFMGIYIKVKIENIRNVKEFKLKINPKNSYRLLNLSKWKSGFLSIKILHNPYILSAIHSK